jgi:formate dehydrogenase gamma subunit
VTRGVRVVRFCKTTRWFHWTFALSFLALAGSGAALLARESLALSPESIAGVIRLHEIAAVVLLTVPWIIALSGDTRAWLADLAEVTRFSRDDVIWLVRQPLAALGRAELPPQDKLNAGQKMNALAVAGLFGALTASGLHLWYEPGAFLAVIVHVGAFVAWLPSFAVHVYMAVINPGTRHALRAMTFGWVERDWAAHHHARWLASVEGTPAPEKPAPHVEPEAEPSA